MNSDLISRKALKRAIKTECNPYGKPTIDFESGKKVLKIIDNAPTVEERPKGEWIADDEWGNCHCSVCNFENNHQPYFCENCGANMVTDLCSICKHGDNCERSDKGISFANHSACWKFER